MNNHKTPSTGNEKPLGSTGKPLTRNQVIGVWGGVIGTVIGCSGWLIAMAAIYKDWGPLLLTLALAVVVILVFGRYCLAHARTRFLQTGMIILIMTTHCLVMYWWRVDVWQAELTKTAEALQKEKTVVTIAVACMVAIVMLQLLVMHWLQQRGRRIR